MEIHEIIWLLYCADKSDYRYWEAVNNAWNLSIAKASHLIALVKDCQAIALPEYKESLRIFEIEMRGRLKDPC